ncbi:hypothetical protein F5J12DRAFT_793425 [Pisolithus orientalis]|uniref:uncharacterized protein n=1 Tax=Pisolithus orientalis TaxID=936130 RepID=UPI002224DB0B|nr:uncharacterized protein F5J12DRAFT_793425 [Pisolithus orientalis]KAI6035439.1 hypothetical protein F5J12DRAFT_793425 [Pisolithus orientalis]
MGHFGSTLHQNAVRVLQLALALTTPVSFPYTDDVEFVPPEGEAGPTGVMCGAGERHYDCGRRFGACCEISCELCYAPRVNLSS